MRILVVCSEHGDSFYDVTTDFQLGFICLKILRDRLEDNCYDDDGGPPSAPDVSEHLVETLPSENLVQQYRQLWKNYHNAMESYDAESGFMSKLRRLLDDTEKSISEKAEDAYKMLQENNSSDDAVYFANLRNPCQIGSGVVTQKPETLKEGHYKVLTTKHPRFVFPGDVVRIEQRFKKTTYAHKGPNACRLHESGIIDLEALEDQNDMC